MKKSFPFLLSFVLAVWWLGGWTARAWSAQVVQFDPSLTGERSLGQPRWERVTLAGGGVRTLALHGTQIFAGGSNFVSAQHWVALPAGHAASTVSTPWSVQRGETRSLCVTRDATLWAATSDGLYAIAANDPSRVVQVDLGSGAGAVVRLACAGDAQAVATEAGTYVALGQAAWQALRGRLRFQAAQAVQWQPLVDRHFEVSELPLARLWILSQSGLWWSEPSAANEMSEPVRVTGFERFASRTPLDLLVAGESLFVLYADGIAVLQSVEREVVHAYAGLAPGAPHDRGPAPDAQGGGQASGPAHASWQWVALALAPGAHAERLFFASGVYWLATDQGLFWAQDPTQAWQRADAPVGFEPIYDVSASGQRVFAAAASGVWQSIALRSLAIEPTQEKVIHETPQVHRPHFASERRAQDPDFAAVRAAALAYLRLEREQLENLNERVAKRGMLPKFVLSTGRGGGKNFARDYDETYASGATHSLHDWQRRRENGWDVAASFTWDFGDTVYHAEMIEVAEERRDALELRDKILDELAQLYFERQRVLLELAAFTDPMRPEAIRLEIRAQELAAGIDAWTGGWFSRAP